MDNNNDQKFWAIIELFGHTMLAGEVAPSQIADFIQINIPEVTGLPPWSKMMNPKAIYGITPCTEEDAREKAEQLKAKPVDTWSMKEAVKKQIDEMLQGGEIKRIEPEEGVHVFGGIEFRQSEDQEIDERIEF